MHAQTDIPGVTSRLVLVCYTDCFLEGGSRLASLRQAAIRERGQTIGDAR